MKKILNRGSLNVSMMLALAIAGCKSGSTSPTTAPVAESTYSTPAKPASIDATQLNTSPAYLDAAAPATQQATATTQQATTMPATHILQAGTVAPTFKLHSNTGKEINLADYVGKQVVVLYFYPKADTPGCTTEACGFRDAVGD
jgi:hypothetical protein